MILIILIKNQIGMTNNEPSKNKISDVFKRYQAQLKGYINKRVASKEDGEDILQNVFYQLLKTENPIDEMTAWLYAVTRNQIIDWKRKRKDEEMPSITVDDGNELFLSEISNFLFDDSDSSPEDVYLRSLVWNELEVALAELPQEQREVFELTELKGLPFKEISESTGIPVNTLISRKRYAVLHLRLRLKSLYEDILDKLSKEGVL